MVTSQLDFMHLRTTAALAGHIKWVARWLKWGSVAKKIKKYQEKAEKAAVKGMVDEVDSALNKEIKLANSEEKDFYTILKGELILFNEEQSKLSQERELDDKLKTAIKALSPREQAEFQEKIEKPLIRVSARNKETGDRVRRAMDALRGDEAAFLEIQRWGGNLLGDKWQEGAIIRDAKKEKRDIKAENKDIDRVMKNIYQLQGLVKRSGKDNAAKIHEKLKELSREEAYVFRAMEDELKYILDTILRGIILFVHLNKGMKNMMVFEAKIKGEGFPPKVMEGLTGKQISLTELMTKHKEDLYKLARYQDRGASALS